MKRAAKGQVCAAGITNRNKAWKGCIWALMLEHTRYSRRERGALRWQAARRVGEGGISKNRAGAAMGCVYCVVCDTVCAGDVDGATAGEMSALLRDA